MGWRQFISAYRVVHRLPGRIRIRIPMLEKLSDEWRSFIKPSVEIIKLKSGIISAEIQPDTGSLLIRYDSDQIDEAQILNWLEKLAVDFIKLGMPSPPLTLTDIRYRFSLLRNSLRKEGVP